METKICYKCNADKPMSEFIFKNRSKGIYHESCKECWKEIRKQCYQKNKKVTTDRNQKNTKKNRDWYVDYKSTLKCSNCPENHPACLEFHHLDPKTKEISVSVLTGRTYSIEKIKREMRKCIVLCSNCHRKYHYSLKESSPSEI